MTAFLSTFTNIVKSLLTLLFQWKVVGDVSIGSIFVALFIILASEFFINYRIIFNKHGKKAKEGK